MSLNLTELRSLRIAELVDAAHDLNIDNAAGLQRQELIFEIVRRKTGAAGGARGEGVLETLPDGFGFLRSTDCNYLPGPDDIYVSPSQIRRFNLRTGDVVAGQVRAPKEGERYFALIKIERINDRSPDSERHKLLFDNLTPIPAHEPLTLAGDDDSADPGLRLIDAVAPLAWGQRVVLYAPAHAGRTHLFHAMASSIRRRHPDAAVFLLLIDERPEEVTELQQLIDAEVISSTFDEASARHVQVAEMVIERARRMVEQGRRVVLFVDSLSRLARAYNETSTATGRLLHGVVDPAALHRARRFFGAGRCLEEGGSLTVVAAVLTDSRGRTDELLIQSLAGAANAELHLDGALAGRRVFPALDLRASRSRGMERFMDVDAIALSEELHDGFTGDVEADRALALARLTGPSDPGPLDKSPGSGKKGLSA